MRKKILLFFFVFLPFFFLFKPIFAKDKVNLYLFWSNTCPHCAKEKLFLVNLQEKYPDLEIKSFEVSTNKENLEYFLKIGSKLNLDTSAVPFTIVCDKTFSGYLDDDTTGKQIEDAVKQGLTSCNDIVSSTDQERQEKDTKTKNEWAANKEGVVPETIKLPIFGTIETKNLSLPALTVAIAFLDGFNPCAMWVLLFLISLLLGMKQEYKRWILGGTFILASAVVYLLFLTAWLNLFLFLGFVFWVRILIGVFALGAGIYYLKEYFVNKEAACKTIGETTRERIFKIAKKITKERTFLISILGIILLAFFVNLIELVCSAGLPALYTKILSLTPLSTMKYYLYLLLYIFIFMLDDMFVFIVAMLTLQATGVHAKYERYSRLIGGILIFVIGVLLLFKPDVLMFR